jgi:GNAT superfamily N-acetyltransferase
MDSIMLAAKPEDVPQLVASVGALFAEDGARRDAKTDLDWPAREGPRYYTAMVGDPSCLCLLAYRKAEPRTPVGHLVGRVRGRNPLRPRASLAVLESMRVDPTCRGQGVGTLLVAQFCEWARSRDANEVSVTAFSANTDAIRFYERNGFSPFEAILHMSL